MRSDVLIVDEEFTGIPENLTSGCLLASNGLFLFRSLQLGAEPFLEVVSKTGPGFEAKGMKEFKDEGVVFYMPRIPRDELLKVEAFFRAVYAEHHSEAVVFLYYTPHEGGRWKFAAPEQEVTVGGVKWTTPGPPPSGWYQVGSIHSHGSGGAFHSGTDDGDEFDWQGIHVTIGKVTSPHPDYAASIVIDGERFKVEIDDLIEPATGVDFPGAWMAQVSKSHPPAVTVIVAGNQPTHRYTQYTQLATKHGGGK